MLFVGSGYTELVQHNTWKINKKQTFLYISNIADAELGNYKRCDDKIRPSKVTDGLGDTNFYISKCDSNLRLFCFFQVSSLNNRTVLLEI